MYQFRSATERILRYRERVRDRVIIGDAEKSVFTAEALEKYKKMAPVIKRPLVTKELCERMTVKIFEDDYFAGTKGKNFSGNSGVMWPIFVPIEKAWTKKQDGLWHNPEGEELRLAISQEDADTIRAHAKVLFENSDSAVGDAWLPDGAKEFFDLRACDYGEMGRPGVMMLACGHLTPGWQKIINVGYGAIRKQAQDFVDARLGNVMGDDMKKYMFYKAVTIVCDGATTLIRRYAAEAKRMADEETMPEKKAELARMSESLSWISENPARNFWEACQAVLMYQLLLSYETTVPGPAFGRFDQYTWPYLKKDLEAGNLTLDQAQELVDAFFLKSNCYYEGNIGKLVETAGIGNTYHHTTIFRR